MEAEWWGGVGCRMAWRTHAEAEAAGTGCFHRPLVFIPSSLGETQSSKRHRAPGPPNAQCCLLSTRPQFLDQENIMIFYLPGEWHSLFFYFLKKILPFG